MVDHPSIEDPSDYFSTDDFGTIADIDSGNEVTGIFNQEWIQDRGVSVESVTFEAETSSLPAIVEKVTPLIHAGVTYKIMLHQKNHGVSILHLQE